MAGRRRAKVRRRLLFDIVDTENRLARTRTPERRTRKMTNECRPLKRTGKRDVTLVRKRISTIVFSFPVS